MVALVQNQIKVVKVITAVVQLQNNQAKSCTKSAQYLLPDIAMKDSLFDEINDLNSLLEVSSDEFNNLPIDKKWSTLFQSKKFVDLRTLVSHVWKLNS
uniref:Uncharacterized protein n=1 Tax=Romanomermis culicivorax TaxID=13658 RepID=A0A915J6N6_ROMCU